MWFGFRESALQLQHKAQAFGLDIGPALMTGTIQIVRHVPVELNVDELMAELATLLEAGSVQRLVIDTIGEIEQSVVDERRRSSVMASLLELLRARGITAVLTRSVHQVVGAELDFTKPPLELLAENVVLLRYVQADEELCRVVSVLKCATTAR